MLEIQNDASLNAANTMALACTASEVVTFTDEAQISSFLADFHQRTHKTNLFVLSGGSNVLLPSKLNACVLRPMLKGVTLLREDDRHAYVKVMAGENWHDFVLSSIGNGWYGLENMALIPGLVGAAPVQNIGAYGVELCDVFEELTAIHLETAEVKTFDKAACQFSYRDSLFKQNPNTWLITHVVFKLHKQPNLTLDYGDVASLATEMSDRSEPTPLSVANAVIQIRQSKLPDPAQIANTGSFFKNPVVDAATFAKLQATHPDIPHYPQADGSMKLAAGWLIDQAGLKGAKLGQIGTHAKQALVVVNHAPYVSKQADITAFSAYIIKKIKQHYGITLEREPVWVNDDGSID